MMTFDFQNYVKALSPPLGWPGLVYQQLALKIKVVMMGKKEWPLISTCWYARLHSVSVNNCAGILSQRGRSRSERNINAKKHCSQEGEWSLPSALQRWGQAAAYWLCPETPPLALWLVVFACWSLFCDPLLVPAYQLHTKQLGTASQIQYDQALEQQVSIMSKERIIMRYPHA